MPGQQIVTQGAQPVERRIVLVDEFAFAGHRIDLFCQEHRNLRVSENSSDQFLDNPLHSLLHIKHSFEALAQAVDFVSKFGNFRFGFHEGSPVKLMEMSPKGISFGAQIGCLLSHSNGMAGLLTQPEAMA